jgi:hypothetical protein
MPCTKDVVSYMDKELPLNPARPAHQSWDLEDVQREQSADQAGLERVPVSFTDIATLSFNLTVMCYATVAILAFTCLIEIIPALRNDGIADFLSGISLCFTVLLLSPAVRARRSDLHNWPQYRYRLLSRRHTTTSATSQCAKSQT